MDGIGPQVDVFHYCVCDALRVGVIQPCNQSTISVGTSYGLIEWIKSIVLL